MARTMVVDSATSQFFINLADNDFLTHKDKTPQGYGYAVFGKVIEGMDIVDAIVALPRNNQDRPDDPPVIREMIVETFGREFPQPRRVS
jgi:cyclophilin family peptidyl-prolyl cis-trans isomerase